MLVCLVCFCDALWPHQAGVMVRSGAEHRSLSKRVLHANQSLCGWRDERSIAQERESRIDAKVCYIRLAWCVIYLTTPGYRILTSAIVEGSS
jgi:hypothetical protein